MSSQGQQDGPESSFIQSHQTLPEITLKSIILSVILVVVFAASNAYLGLKVGTTISASIPAAVIAMGVFRMFKRHSVLEINIVQTAASVGEGITAGIIFTIPALIIMHFWTEFNYWQTFFIGLTGGILGALYSVPLRRALLSDKTLKFPEGVAIGQVMKASAQEGANLKPIFAGGFIGALIGLFQTGFRVLAQGYQYWVVHARTVFGFGLGFSPALIAAGYICGISVGISTLIGVILGWIIGVPVLCHHFHVPLIGSPSVIAGNIWFHYIQYIGVGTMLVGGLWTLLTLCKPVIKAVTSSLHALREIRKGKGHKILRTERDMPINIIFWCVLLLAPVFFLEIWSFISPSMLGISNHLGLFLFAVCVVYLFIAGFIFSSVAGYFSGLVGATNNPGSGLMIATLLVLSLLFLVILNGHMNFASHNTKTMTLAALAIIVCAFVGNALVMSSESAQVAKAGQMIGGTPWKQQIVLISCVIIGMAVLPLILKLLFNAYGIGGVFPHAGMDHTQVLAAPQAGLMAAVVQGVITHHLPWGMVGIGAIIAVIGIIIDEILKATLGIRFPVLAVGLGIYLPLDASVPIVVGGILSYIVRRAVRARGHGLVGDSDDIHVSKGMQNALLLACGIVAGATLIGVILAVPFAIKQSADALRIMPLAWSNLAGVLSIVVTLLICYWIYRTAIKN